MTSEKRACEEHFDNTHVVSSTGRFIVKLPLKIPQPALGQSRSICLRRLKQLESRLSRQPQYRHEYNQFMREYREMGHMVSVPREEIYSSKNLVCYHPHQFVVKETSTTTKFRTVFDCSSKTDNGVSLNDALMVGPVIQDSLFNIILRFRKHPIAFTADIAKMYRQILVSDEDSDLQRILWREDPSHPVQDYRLITVTSGTASAPYLATKVLQQLAVNHQGSLPLGSQAVLNDTYMDDVMSGAPTSSEAIEVKNQLLELMESGGFSLRKWSSNCPQLLLSLPPEQREKESVLQLDIDQTVKALGTHWCTSQDEILFKVTIPVPEPLKEGGADLSKRKVLSEMSKLWDLPGFLAPVTIKPKILVQQLWKMNIGWDDSLPAEIQQEWNLFKTQLPLIEKIRIKRSIMPLDSTRVSLVGFCDASERAYAAVVYVRADSSIPNHRPHVSIVASKTRVAPVKQVSLPRLELCGAVLLSQLMPSVQTALKIDFDSVSAFTDSTDVLGWINAHPSRWKTFIANRVVDIQDQVPETQWGHVKRVDNPADCASRGLDPQERDHPLWWTGPNWLSHGEIPVTGKTYKQTVNCELEERKIIVCANAVIQQDVMNLCKFSSLTKLKRVTAWCLRFLNNCKVKSVSCRQNGPITPLTPQELEEALIWWIHHTQQQSFSLEVQCLRENKPLPTKSRISPLNTFMDSSGILRVGGRLRHAKLPLDQRTPILVPRHHHFTSLLIMSTHLENYHAGPQLVQSILTRRFWIVGARDAYRHRLKKCVTCVRHRGVTMQPFMGNLPAARVNPVRAFLNSGIDYAGPFVLRPINTRSKVTIKAYMALFVCLTTRAVHLELVSSLSTDAFLVTLRRCMTVTVCKKRQIK